MQMNSAFFRFSSISGEYFVGQLISWKTWNYRIDSMVKSFSRCFSFRKVSPSPTSIPFVSDISQKYSLFSVLLILSLFCRLLFCCIHLAFCYCAHCLGTKSWPRFPLSGPDCIRTVSLVPIRVFLLENGTRTAICWVSWLFCTSPLNKMSQFSCIWFGPF